MSNVLDRGAGPSPRGHVMTARLHRLPESGTITLDSAVLARAGIMSGAVLYCRPQGDGKILILALARTPAEIERFKHLLPPEGKASTV